MRVIAIALQAGGVGKTTLTHNLGVLLADRGRKVLLVDTDGQCNLTEVLDVDPSQEPTIYDVLLPQGDDDDTPPRPITEAIREVKIRKSLALVPSSPKMGRFDAAVAARQHREYFLRDALATLQGFDYVLIDCPPGLGLVLTNTLMAAHEVLIPVFTRQRRVNALPIFLKVLLRAQRFNPQLRLAGIVPNHYDRRTTHDRAAYAYIQRFAAKHGFPVFPAIPPTVRFSEAEAKKLPLSDYDRTPAAADALEQITALVDGGLLEPAAVAEPAVSA